MPTDIQGVIQRKVNEVDDINFAEILYTDSQGRPEYMCQAAPGTLSSAASWRIRKITYTGETKEVTTWADGNDKFDNIADNYASLTYT